MRGFLLLVAAGLGSAALGCGLGWLIGLLSPEFIALVAGPTPVADSERLGAAMGMVSGLLLGVLAMALGLVVEVFRVWAVSSKSVPHYPPNQPFQQPGALGSRVSSTAVQRPGS